MKNNYDFRSINSNDISKMNDLLISRQNLESEVLPFLKNSCLNVKYITITNAMKTGSVITMDKGVLTLAKLASVSKAHNDRIFPYLLNHLENCRSKEVP